MPVPATDAAFDDPAMVAARHRMYASLSRWPHESPERIAAAAQRYGAIARARLLLVETLLEHLLEYLDTLLVTSTPGHAATALRNGVIQALILGYTAPPAAPAPCAAPTEPEGRDDRVAIRFRLDAGARLVYTILTGEVTEADLPAYASVLAAHPTFDPTFAELVDARAEQCVAVTPARLRYFASRAPFRAGARGAVIAPTDVLYGLARMMQAVSEGEAELGVFRDAEAACAWLGLEP